MSCKTFVIFATDSPQYAAIGWKSPQFWVQFWPPGLIGPLPMQSIHNIELLTFVKTEQFVLLWGASEPECKTLSINGQVTQNLENDFGFKILSTLSEIRNLTAKRYWHLVQILSIPTKNWPAIRKMQVKKIALKTSIAIRKVNESLGYLLWRRKSQIIFW